jgi:hypothetical protein
MAEDKSKVQLQKVFDTQRPRPTSTKRQLAAPADRHDHTQGQTLTADNALAGLGGMGTISYPSQRGWQEIAFSWVKV